MAEEKNVKVTEVQALEVAIDFLGDAGNEFADVVEKLEKMLATRQKPRERKTDDSKRLANIERGKKFAEVWNGDTFKAADVASVLEVSIPQANQVCKAMGWEKVPTTEKVNVYKL